LILLECAIETKPAAALNEVIGLQPVLVQFEKRPIDLVDDTTAFQASDPGGGMDVT
jgi:predicted nucleotidyltransferase